MWFQSSELFTNREDAYQYFLKRSPNLDDLENEAKQRINNIIEPKGYSFIEFRCQLGGYIDNLHNRAKRPFGVVIGIFKK